MAKNLFVMKKGACRV